MNAIRNPFEGRTLIGRTMFKSPKAARLFPLATVEADRWGPVGQLGSETQKKEGVFCLDHAVLDQPEGLRFFFRVVTNDQYDGVRNTDKLIAVEACKALDVIMDLKDQDSESQRMLVVGKGVLRACQKGDRAVLPLDDHSCLYPRLVQDRDTGRWRIAPDEDLARLPVLAFDVRDLGAGPAENGNWYYLPGKTPFRKIRTLNWQYDGDYLETLLNQVRKHVERQSSPELVGLSKATIKRLRSLHATGEPLHEVAEEAKAIADRLVPFLNQLDATTDVPERLTHTLLTHPRVSRAIEECKAALLTEAEPAIRAEIEKRVYNEIYDLDRERHALKHEIERLGLEIEDAQVRLHNTENMIAELLPNIRRDAEEFFGPLVRMGKNVQILRELIGGTEQSTSVSSFRQASSPWDRDRIETATEFESEEIPVRLLDAAKRAGFDLATIAAFDIALRAGDIPVLYGAGATFLLERYVLTMAAGRLHTHVVDASLLGPDDLWRHPTRNEPTALASAWQTAERERSSIHIVALRDVHRGSGSDWLETLADLLRSSAPTNLFVVATAPESASVGQRGIAIDANGGLNAALAVAATARLRSIAEPALTLRLSGGAEPNDSIQDLIGCLQDTSFDERGATAYVLRRRAARPWRSHIPGLDMAIAKSIDLSAKPSTLQTEIRRTLGDATATEAKRT